ncbi:MFS transporter [Acutalibacter caecimuris]|uniref:MFS transporter n=1 Tax=Acutalibacter caecimuris TaxID=3093657 RepID=UPI002AC8D42F|nr:MFS transporter [Acutalibacter sp. M00118]
MTLLTICAFLPTIFFRFIAGALADRWNKKRIMLCTDLIAAFGTAAVLVLFSFSALMVWHLYVINILLSFMNAFQNPVSFVATSLLVPKKYYTRVGGLQSFSGSAISILAPALGSCLLAFGGMTVVLVCDLVSFSVAFFILLFFIKIPEIEQPEGKTHEPFLKSCLEGIHFLWAHPALVRITLFIACINFLAKLGNDGMLAPFVLGRTRNNQQALGMVQSAVSLGLLAGSVMVTMLKPAKDKPKVVFVTTAFVFLGNIVQSLSFLPWVWCMAAFASYIPAVIMNANLTAILREHIPLEMQGRVFSAKDSLQSCTIPLGLLVGGLLADHVLEPFMAADSPMQTILSHFFGSGNGAGIAVMFFSVGILGIAISLSRLRKPVYKSLNRKDPNP